MRLDNAECAYSVEFMCRKLGVSKSGHYDWRNCLHQGLRVLVYPSGVDVSSSTLRFLSARLRTSRRERGTRWRRLTCG
ncbi:hypothetical protein ACFWP1_37875, partial [Streptomyces sp. NPDC058425]